jgi:hypothetical protein
VRHHTLKIGLLAATLAVITAGCSTPQVDGTPGPQTNGVDAAGKLPSGAPHVAKPLDTSRAQAAPCSVLTPAQVSSLGIVATGKAHDSATGPACSWDDTTATPTPVSIGIGFVTKSTGGLSSLYVQAESLKSNGGYFEPVAPVQGYPAVLYSQVDYRKRAKNADCNMAVGVSDALQFTVGVTVMTPTPQLDPCVIEKKAVDMIMTTLLAGS